MSKIQDLRLVIDELKNLIIIFTLHSKKELPNRLRGSKYYWLQAVNASRAGDQSSWMHGGGGRQVRWTEKYPRRGEGVAMWRIYIWRQWMDLNVYSRILNSLWNWTGRNCSCFGTDMMWWTEGILAIKQAAKFGSSWSLCGNVWVRLKRRVLQWSRWGVTRPRPRMAAAWGLGGAD